jgi:hypothetical protein
MVVLLMKTPPPPEGDDGAESQRELKRTSTAKP